MEEGLVVDATSPVIDRATFEGLLEAVGGDRAFIVELIDTYVADAPLQLQSMRAATVAGSAADLVRPVHTLKSSSASLGALTLADLCGSIEARARAGEVEGAATAVGNVALALDAVLTALTELASAT
jgi:HPt (histidine-containing phosphotransfer) domain-containing protein